MANRDSARSAESLTTEAPHSRIYSLFTRTATPCGPYEHLTLMEILYSGTDMSFCSSLKWMLTDSGIRYETNTRLYKIQINDADEVHQILVHPEDWDRAARELDALTRQANRKDTPSPVIASSNRKIRLAIVIMMGVLGILAFTQLSRSGPTPCLFLPQTLPQPDGAGK